MKKHTLPIILSSIVALTVATQNSFANVSKDNLKSSGNELLMAYLNFGEALWVAASDAVNDGIDAAKDAVNRGVDAAKDAVNRGVDAAKDAVNRGVDAVNQAGQWVGDKLYEAHTGMVQLQDRMIENAIETGRNVRDWGVRVARNAEEMARDGWEQAGEYWIRFSDKMHNAYGAVEMFVQTQTCRYKVNMKTALEAFKQIGEIPKERILAFHTCLEEQDEWAKLVSEHGHVIGQDLKCYGVLGAPNSPKIYDAFVEMYNARVKGWNESCGGNATAKEVVVAGVPVVLGPIEEAAALAKNVAVTSAGALIVSENSASDYSTECPRVDYGVIDNAGYCQDACRQYEELHTCLLSVSNPYSYNGVSKQCICNPDKVAGSDVATKVDTDMPVETLAPAVTTGPKIGDSCSVQFSTAAQYINVGGGEIKCAATACQPGSYLVKNEQGVSQGWCKWGTDPLVLAQQKRDEMKAQLGTIENLTARSIESVGVNTLSTPELMPQREVMQIQDSLSQMSNRDFRRQERQEARQERQEARQERREARQAEKDARNLEQQIADDAKGEVAFTPAEFDSLFEQDLQKFNYL